MATGRAILTEAEKEYIRGKHGDQRKYEAKSRVRKRINEELADDIDFLNEHHPDLLEELREVVCDERSQDE
jgi:hypothetical protein